MKILLVTHGVKGWPTNIPDAEVVDGKEYLTQPPSTTNCVEQSIQSLQLLPLSEYQVTMSRYWPRRRGHKPFPNVTTTQDFKTLAIVRMVPRSLRTDSE